MRTKSLALSNLTFERLTKSALDRNRIVGLTHNFYRYPARFSPTFASTAIQLFSKHGDIVLDPYMGGGTTIVEAMIAGRRAIGVDLNSLSLFLTKVKTTRLNILGKKAISFWAESFIPQLTYRNKNKETTSFSSESKTKNLTLPQARFIKKVVTIALASIDFLPNPKTKNFARCAILKTGQWALDGRKTHISLEKFRAKLRENINLMLKDLEDFERCIRKHRLGRSRCKLFEIDASMIDKLPIFVTQGMKADLVVTSPPYPGLHILYHRWQVNGRRETPAPYWIAGCEDGQGDSYYNFGSRHQPCLHSYFETSLRTLKAICKVMRPGGIIVQMIAFSDPQTHLPRYLKNMEKAGFEEVKLSSSITEYSDDRIWRNVPNRNCLLYTSPSPRD